MDIEIVYDPRETLQASGILLSERHRRCGTSYPWLEWCQQQAPDARLFVYRHTLSGRFELCNWLYSPSESSAPLFMEIEGFDGEPGHLWPDGLIPPCVMECRLRPITEHVARQQKQARDAASLRKSELDINKWARNDRAKFLRTQGLHDEAMALAAGQGHYTPPELMGDRHSELMETFRPRTTTRFV